LVDVNRIIHEILTLLDGEALRSSVAMRTELAAELPDVMADRVQLQQVFMNLMLNGIEAMRDSGGELTVKSQVLDSQVLFSVSDTGVGLPMEKMDQIFSAFFTTKPQGSGMGLAISRSIVESHGWPVVGYCQRWTGCNVLFQLADPCDGLSLGRLGVVLCPNIDGMADGSRIFVNQRSAEYTRLPVKESLSAG
jgi:C4-dicarboxylate-specific signal transduction histidine kinase